MPASASARRYANAAFNVAGQTGDYDGWLNTLSQFARVLQMPSARTVFMSPAVPTSEKRAALDRLVPNAPPMVRNFLHILADRDRLDEVPGIAEHLRDLINQQRGIITAEVTTAIALDASMTRLVAQRLAAYLNRDPDTGCWQVFASVIHGNPLRSPATSGFRLWPSAVVGWDRYGGPVYQHRNGKKFTFLDGITPLVVAD